MAEVILFHHAQGLTEGVKAFAEELRLEGHVIHLPDLYEGRTFSALSDGIAYAKETGFETIVDRGRAAAEELPQEVVYAGFSLGVLPAQMLAQTRPGAKGALFFHSALPASEFGDGWPAGVPLQIHTMESDELGDVEVARELAGTIDGAELFLYPGNGHLFADSSLAEYDKAAATLLSQRVRGFLESL